MVFPYVIRKAAAASTLGMNITIYSIVRQGVIQCETRYSDLATFICNALNQRVETKEPELVA